MGTTTSRLRVYQFHHLGKTFETLLLLLLSRRNIIGVRTAFLLLEHRNIICCRFLLWNFEYRWIRKPCLTQFMSLLLSKVS